MKPIVLTAMRGGTYSDPHDEPVYVNPELIQQFGRHGADDARTFVDFGNEHFLYVRETPGEIDNLLRRNRNFSDMLNERTPS